MLTPEDDEDMAADEDGGPLDAADDPGALELLVGPLEVPITEEDMTDEEDGPGMEDPGADVAPKEAEDAGTDEDGTPAEDDPWDADDEAAREEGPEPALLDPEVLDCVEDPNVLDPDAINDEDAGGLLVLEPAAELEPDATVVLVDVPPPLLLLLLSGSACWQNPCSSHTYPAPQSSNA